MEFDPVAEAIASIRDSLKVAGAEVVSPQVVEVADERRNEHGFPRLFIAGRLEGVEFTGDEVGVWAMGMHGNTGGPLFAVNDVARTYTPWGEAATPGSRADRMMQDLATYPEAAEAENAARR